MAAATLEDILGRLLVPDNATIQQATKELQSVFKDPAIVTALCEVLAQSVNPQVRQYAAVLLRKKVVQVWKQLPPESQLVVKSTLLQALGQETIRLVLHSIAHLVAVIVKRDFCAKAQWSQLNTFILEHWNSAELAHKELAILLLSKLMDTAAYYYQGEGQFPLLLQMFSAALDNSAHQTLTYYALRSLTSMVAYVGSDDMVVFRDLIPKIMAAVTVLIQQDEDRACEGMELFDELIESDAGIVVPHLPSLIQFCLNLAVNSNLGNNVRVKALSFVSWLASLKKKALLRQGLLPTILRTMLDIMATPTSDENEIEDSSESQSPTTLAAQVLDVLSNHLPPDKLFTPLIDLLSPWVESENEHQRAAALVAIAVITEGCSDHIRQNHLSTLLQVVYKAVEHSSQVVRNAALFAIGQFAEFLQPDISEYSGQLMPVLFQFLDMAVQSEQQGRPTSSITKVFYALESFIEQLGCGLDPYLPALMDKLFLALAHTKNIHVQELVISSFGAAANACEDKLQPYFQRVIQVLMEFINLPHTPDSALLQAQSIDTLGTLARTIGEESFRPLAQDCITLGMNLMQSEDPDTRRSVYGMFASVSCVMKEELGPHLEAIVDRMLESLTSDEGVKVHYTSFNISFFNFDEGEEEGGGANMNGSDDEDAIEGYSVENSYLEEKEDTCNALGEIAENVQSQFLPYIDNCFKEVSVLTEHSMEGLRKAALWTLGRFCKVWYKCIVTMAMPGREDLEILINSTLLSSAATVRTDADRSVVIATLEMLEDLFKGLREVGPFPIGERPLSSLLVSVQDVFTNKAQCLEEEEGLDEMSEYDSALVECAGSVLGPLAGAVGGGVFLPQLQEVLPKLVEKLNGSDGDQSFAVGTLAEIVDGLGSHACQVTSLYQTFVDYSGPSKAEEVCSNSVYGLGVLAANGGAEMVSNYHSILQHLFSVLHNRQSAKMKRIHDNVCGAVCRMIVAHDDAVPLDQVIPVLLGNLPLKEDMEENETVYKCLQHLLSTRIAVVLPHLSVLLKVFAQDLSSSSKLSKELKQQLAGLVKALNVQCPAEMQAASAGLDQTELQILTNALNA